MSRNVKTTQENNEAFTHRLIQIITAEVELGNTDGVLGITVCDDGCAIFQTAKVSPKTAIDILKALEELKRIFVKSVTNDLIARIEEEERLEVLDQAEAPTTPLN